MHPNVRILAASKDLVAVNDIEAAAKCLARSHVHLRTWACVSLLMGVPSQKHSVAERGWLWANGKGRT
jgi:hypothetical protein